MNKNLVVASLLGVVVLVIITLIITADTPAIPSETGDMPGPTTEESTTTPENTVGAKIDVRVACESALAYTDFMDGASAELFVEECVNGEHPEVIERYIESLELEEGMAV